LDLPDLGADAVTFLVVAMELPLKMINIYFVNRINIQLL